MVEVTTTYPIDRLSKPVLEAVETAGILEDPYADRLVARIVKMNESEYVDDQFIIDTIPSMPGNDHLIAPDGDCQRVGEPRADGIVG